MEAVGTVLREGAVEVRPADFAATAGGRLLDLTVRELDLLVALIERTGRIVSREELFRAVWGDRYRKSDRSVDVYVAKLRQKLAEAVPDARYIHTHFGFGYRFAEERRGESPSHRKPSSQRFHIRATTP